MNIIYKPFKEIRAVVLAGFLMFVPPLVAEAGVITFNDLTDSVTLTTDIPARIAGTGCVGETCTLRVFRPTDPLGGTLNSFSWSTANIFDTSGVLSDTLNITVNTVFQDGFIDMIFRSDVEGGPALSLISGGNAITENGSVQLATMIGWGFSSGTNLSDSIQFQSDVVDRVPEPSMISLFGLALVALGFSRRKKA